MKLLEDLSSAVIAGNEKTVKELTEQALNEGLDPLKIINNGLVPGMAVVGEKFKQGEMFVPEVLMSAQAMSGGMELIKPLIVDRDIQYKGTVVIGTVKGDLHDIGKNLVSMMMESIGFKVINLGVDVAPEKFVETMEQNDADIIAMSALLTTTMMEMKNTIDLLENKGLRDKVKVMVGGAPVTGDFAEKIGADGFAPDASSATDLAQSLLNK